MPFLCSDCKKYKRDHKCTANFLININEQFTIFDLINFLDIYIFYVVHSLLEWTFLNMTIIQRNSTNKKIELHSRNRWLLYVCVSFIQIWIEHGTLQISRASVVRLVFHGTFLTLRSLQEKKWPNVYPLFSEIGVGLAGFGVAFLFLGMLLLFDKGLLAVGNVSMISRYFTDDLAMMPTEKQCCQLILD